MSYAVLTRVVPSPASRRINSQLTLDDIGRRVAFLTLRDACMHAGRVMDSHTERTLKKGALLHMQEDSVKGLLAELDMTVEVQVKIRHNVPLLKVIFNRDNERGHLGIERCYNITLPEWSAMYHMVFHMAVYDELHEWLSCTDCVKQSLTIQRNCVARMLARRAN